MKNPNFFMVGAPKCGTTSLAAWLAEHPNVFLSAVKELYFFCSDFDVGFVSNQSEYDNWFKDAGDEHIAVGEASTAYLFSKAAVPSIKKKYPDARYIVMLRNPVEMAYSLHDQIVFAGREHIQDFKLAWRMSPQRRAGKMVARHCKDPCLLDYQFRCLLGRQSERLLETVPREAVLFLFLEDVKKNPGKEYLRVLSFLGVPDDGRRVFPVKNPAKERTCDALQKGVLIMERGSHFVKKRLGIPVNRGTGILKMLGNRNTRYRSRPALPPELKQEMRDYFREDVEKLYLRIKGSPNA